MNHCKLPAETIFSESVPDSSNAGQDCDDTLVVDGAVSDPCLFRDVSQLIDQGSVVV